MSTVVAVDYGFRWVNADLDLSKLFARVKNAGPKMPNWDIDLTHDRYTPDMALVHKIQALCM